MRFRILTEEQTDQTEPDTEPDVKKCPHCGSTKLVSRWFWGRIRQSCTDCGEMLEPEQPNKKATPDENLAEMETAVQYLWTTGRINFKGERAVLKRAVIVRNIKTHIVRNAIQSFIVMAENEGIISEEQEDTLLNFLLESYPGDFI